MKSYTYKGVEDSKLTEGEVPGDFLDQAMIYREELIEKVAEFDDAVLSKYLEGQELSEADIKKAIRTGVTTGKFFPILGGDNRTATTQLLLDAVVEYLPSPLDVPPVEGQNPVTGEVEKREPKYDAPFSALAFKVVTDPHVGRLVYIRIYSGKVKAGEVIYNVSKQKQERIGKLVLLHADQRELIEEAFTGEIVAVVGIRDSSTGDSLSSVA